MSGHSKWSTIKHKKAKLDAARGKVFTKVVKEITVAAREGGGDPEGNARLRTVLDKAKACNMPQDNIARAIKKGTGELEGAHYEAVTYEGYGPAGTAVMVEALTDNRNRTAADLRHVFTKNHGNMAEGGAVAWMFEHKGVVRATGSINEDELLEKLLDYDIDDISSYDGIVTVSCAIKDLYAVKKVVEDAGLKVDDAQIEWLAKTPMHLDHKDEEEKVFKFLEALEDNDDVQNVYSNIG